MNQSCNKSTVATGKHVRMVCEDGWEYFERLNTSGVVVIVAVTDDDKLVLTEQYRIPVGHRVVDLPAGLAGDIPGHENEELETAARRELLEETGFEAHEIRYLAHGPTSAGLTSEKVTFFLAEAVSKVAAGGGDDSEEIEVREVSLDGIREWLRSVEQQDRLIDPKVYAGLYFLVTH